MTVIAIPRASVRQLIKSFAVLAIAASMLAGCGGAARPPVITEFVPYTPEQNVAREGAKDARYRLRNGDRFSIAFKFEPELDVENVLVLPDGYVALKGLSQSVRAAGVTIEALDDALEAAYGSDYKNPDLSILVHEIEAPEVYVLGAVKQPGLYRLPEKGRGVIQAVAMAGGFLDSAKKSQTVLMRATDSGFMTRSYDISRLGEVQVVGPAMSDIEPYDIIYVPRKGLHNLAESVDMVFSSILKVSGFFWDVYAIANLDKIQTVVR